MILPRPLLSCESSVSVKENPNYNKSCMFYCIKPAPTSRFFTGGINLGTFEINDLDLFLYYSLAPPGTTFSFHRRDNNTIHKHDCDYQTKFKWTVHSEKAYAKVVYANLVKLAIIENNLIYEFFPHLRDTFSHSTKR